MLKFPIKLGTILILFLFLSLNANQVYAAPNNIEVNKVYTEVLPEYDKPEVLVINTIDFKNNTSQDFAGPLKWFIPKGSNTQIVSDDPNSKDNLTFNLIQNKDYDEINWNLKTPLKAGETRSIHLEYYYNNFQGIPDKKFSFDLIPAYNIAASQIVVNQPTKATNFKINPDFGQPTNNQGLTLFSKDFPAISPGQKQTVNVSYTKSDQSLTVASTQNQQTQPNGQTTTSKSNTLYIILFAVALIIVTILVLSIINNKKQISKYEDLAIDYSTCNDEDEEEDSNEVVTDIINDDTIKSDVLEKSEQRYVEEKKIITNKFKKGLITEEEYNQKLLELV